MTIQIIVDDVFPITIMIDNKSKTFQANVTSQTDNLVKTYTYGQALKTENEKQSNQKQ